jgi:hypothetical protein
MGSGRPGGNPGLKKYAFHKIYDWGGEPCSKNLTVRIPPSLEKAIKSRENWQEFVRVAIASAIEEEEKAFEDGESSP